MTYLVAVDPGVATGICLGYYSETEPWRRIDTWIVKDGIEGFIRWYYTEAPDLVHVSEWVVEKFVLSGGNDFVANTEPLRIEGAIIALGLKPVWNYRYDKALCKDEVLKKHKLWVTGKMVNHTDGRDANDAAIHSLALMKKRAHIPSLKHYWGPDD